MIRFLKALLVFLMMYRDGFYWSKNMHPNLGGGHWGFYRFNSVDAVCLFDVDLDFDKKRYGYYHVHGDDFRFTSSEHSKVDKIRVRTRLVK